MAKRSRRQRRRALKQSHFKKERVAAMASESRLDCDVPGSVDRALSSKNRSLDDDSAPISVSANKYLLCDVSCQKNIDLNQEQLESVAPPSPLESHEKMALTKGVDCIGTISNKTDDLSSVHLTLSPINASKETHILASETRSSRESSGDTSTLGLNHSSPRAKLDIVDIATSSVTEDQVAASAEGPNNTHIKIDALDRDCTNCMETDSPEYVVNFDFVDQTNDTAPFRAMKSADTSNNLDGRLPAETPATPANEKTSSNVLAAGQTSPDATSPTATTREEDIARTQEELGATSLAFLHRLRGAAFRRKKRLVNSRNDLVAKELIHRQDVEASRLQLHQLEEQEVTTSEQDHIDCEQPTTIGLNLFKARPVSQSLSMGCAGIPKVDKRPVTIPLSPLLGPRRQLPEGSISQTIRRGEPSDLAPNNYFSALPLPKATGARGHGGQSGLPKVGKRPVTNPMSPLLGPRRPCDNYNDTKKSGLCTTRSESDIYATNPVFKALPLPKSLKTRGVSGIPNIPSRPPTIPCSPLLGFRRPQEARSKVTKDRPYISGHKSRNLVPPSHMGLDFLGSASRSTDENEPPVTGNQITFEPRSTARAQKRAEFESYRTTEEKARLAGESRARVQKVKALRKELNDLKGSL